MSSRRILLAAGFGPGFSASFTVPAGTESAVITGWGGYNGNHVAGYAAIFVNNDGAAAYQFAGTDGGFGQLLRIGLVAGDVVNVFSSVAGFSVSVTANISP